MLAEVSDGRPISALMLRRIWDDWRLLLRDSHGRPEELPVLRQRRQRTPRRDRLLIGSQLQACDRRPVRLLA